MTPMTPHKKPVSPVLIVVLVIGAVSMFCCVGTLGAVAVPNFVKFGGKAKQSEVKTNLKSFYTAERMYFSERDTYSEFIEVVGHIPPRGNRYRYLLAADGDLLVPGGADAGMHTSVGADSRNNPPPNNASLLSRIPPALLAEVRMKGTCPDACSITMLAVAALDQDATVDIWSISTEARTIDGEVVPEGVPHKHVDDINE